MILKCCGGRHPGISKKDSRGQGPPSNEDTGAVVEVPAVD